MSTTTKKSAAQGVRYTDAQKKEVVDFIHSYNAANGRGGQSKAGEKFKISQITIASWLKAAGASALPASSDAQAPEAAEAPKAANGAKATKAAKPAKAPKAVGNSKAGTRYTTEQKREVTDFVASYNAENGRGGQSKAAGKFGVSPLTVMAWLKASGGEGAAKKVSKKDGRYVAPGKVAKVAKPAQVIKAPKSVVSGSSDAKLSSLVALIKEIAVAERVLARLNAKFNSMKVSL